jgi:asparagine synthase (glutamine-hydrolysing)
LIYNNNIIHLKVHRNQIDSSCEKGKNRGPEYSKVFSYENMYLGFHRLAINGLDEVSNQPFLIDNILLVCNGEIYNYKKIIQELGFTPKTNSDCEVIIHLYLKYGIDYTLSLLDGVFSFVLVDLRQIDDIDTKIYVARDPLGVRPLYQILSSKKGDSTIMFSSEVKSMYSLYNSLRSEHVNYNLSQFEPGSYSEVTCLKDNTLRVENKKYFTFTPSFSLIDYCNQYEPVNVRNNIYELFKNAVKKRVDNTDRPIACLLSGGLDSSLVCSLVSSFLKEKNPYNILETYSIGLENSDDIINARVVAKFLNTKHHEIVISEDDFFNAIDEVIYTIESYDVTTVRASIGNYLVSKYISENSNAKVIFNGDGADELFGGYLYTQNCPDAYEFDCETRRLLKDIHLFDVLRSDKSISSNGLEPRTPFLDKSLVNYYLMLPNEIKYIYHKKGGKNIIREAFDNSEKPYLPDSILWRKKEAFSDGVSTQKRSLFLILQEKIKAADMQNYGLLNGVDIEKIYYKMIYDKHYPNTRNLLPYYWMPKYTSSNDPSARTIEIY